jgi:hypothetical protein
MLRRAGTHSSSPAGICIEDKLLVDKWICTPAWPERVEQVASFEELTSYYSGHARK